MDTSLIVLAGYPPQQYTVIEAGKWMQRKITSPCFVITVNIHPLDTMINTGFTLIWDHFEWGFLRLGWDEMCQRDRPCCNLHLPRRAKTWPAQQVIGDEHRSFSDIEKEGK